MFFAYVDESGDTGKKGSKSYALGCVLVEAKRWPDVFDQVLGFRRFLREKHRIPVRAELKANFLLSNGGPLRPLGLSEATRFGIYRGFMRLLSKLDLQAFAVVIRKETLSFAPGTRDPRDLAWETIFQRFERFTNKHGPEPTPLLLVHDEGDGPYVRKAARKARRFQSAGQKYGQGSLSVPVRHMVEDPVSRASHESYFVQLADLVAYAAFRRVYPPPCRPVQIVPTTMWDEVGTARLAAVNRLTPSAPPGIVIRPPLP